VATAIYLPKVGMTMEEATLTKWLEPDGAEVKRGQLIFEMETEKVQMEVEAEADGHLKHLAMEGAELHPGDVIGCLLAVGEEVPQSLLDQVTSQSGDVPAASQSIAALAEATAPDAPRSSAEVTRPDASGMVRVSPVARRLADEHGIDVRTLTGSGPDGRIVERDVQRAIEARTAAGSAPAPTAAPPPVAPQHAAALPMTPAASGSVPYTGRRRIIGERMHDSLASMAQLTLVSETPVDEGMKVLHGLNREWRKDNVVVTLTALIVKACALALREHPQLNARLDAPNGAIVIEQDVNVGVAVAQDAGLIVPVVRNADRLSLKELAAILQDQVRKAREDRLAVQDVEGGTFTVTSLEGTSVDAFTPIINPPQAAILGVGRVRDIAAFEGSEVVKRQATTLSLTFDHRVTDGQPAARFLDRVAELLERPYLLM
jgi:pyruvate dehydrogenase E2 component (dihydrolipoyllysine-residue acetyltransferase)